MAKALSNITRPDIIKQANAIAKEYIDDGLTMTLRQLYYQFVARGLATLRADLRKRGYFPDKAGLVTYTGPLAGAECWLKPVAS